MPPCQNARAVPRRPSEKYLLSSRGYLLLLLRLLLKLYYITLKKTHIAFFILFLSFRNSIKHLSFSMKSFILLAILLLCISIAPTRSTTTADPHLPRPLILQFPSVDAEKEDLIMWCQSWRFAGEANKLAPWKSVPEDCAAYVKDYVTGKGYRFDLEIVATVTLAYARSFELADDGMDAWVFDIDETLLSNLPYYSDHGFG